MSEQEFFKDLRAALLLMRDLRLKAVNLDARCVRIALKYALLIDDYVSKGHITPEDEQRMTACAQKLFNETPKGKVGDTNAIIG